MMAPEEFLKHLNDDYDYVLGRVKLNGQLLMYVSDRLRNDTNIVFAAISQNSAAFMDAGENIISDRRHMVLIKKAVQLYADNVLCLSKDMQNDKNLLLEFIESNPFVYDFINVKFKTDKDILDTTFHRNVSKNFEEDSISYLNFIKDNLFAEKSLEDMLAQQEESFIIDKFKTIESSDESYESIVKFVSFLFKYVSDKTLPTLKSTSENFLFQKKINPMIDNEISRRKILAVKNEVKVTKKTRKVVL